MLVCFIIVYQTNAETDSHTIHSIFIICTWLLLLFAGTIPILILFYKMTIQYDVYYIREEFVGGCLCLIFCEISLIALTVISSSKGLSIYDLNIYGLIFAIITSLSFFGVFLSSTAFVFRKWVQFQAYESAAQNMKRDSIDDDKPTDVIYKGSNNPLQVPMIGLNAGSSVRNGGSIYEYHKKTDLHAADIDLFSMIATVEGISILVRFLIENDKKYSINNLTVNENVCYTVYLSVFCSVIVLD